VAAIRKNGGHALILIELFFTTVAENDNSSFLFEGALEGRHLMIISIVFL